MEVLLNINMKINGMNVIHTSFLKENFEKVKRDAFSRCLEIINSQHFIFHQFEVSKTANIPYPMQHVVHKVG